MIRRAPDRDTTNEPDQHKSTTTQVRPSTRSPVRLVTHPVQIVDRDERILPVLVWAIVESPTLAFSRELAWTPCPYLENSSNSLRLTSMSYRSCNFPNVGFST